MADFVNRGKVKDKNNFKIVLSHSEAEVLETPYLKEIFINLKDEIEKLMIVGVTTDELYKYYSLNPKERVKISEFSELEEHIAKSSILFKLKNYKDMQDSIEQAKIRLAQAKKGRDRKAEFFYLNTVFTFAERLQKARLKEQEIVARIEQTKKLINEVKVSPILAMSQLFETKWKYFYRKNKTQNDQFDGAESSGQKIKNKIQQIDCEVTKERIRSANPVLYSKTSKKDNQEKKE